MIQKYLLFCTKYMKSQTSEFYWQKKWKLMHILRCCFLVFTGDFLPGRYPWRYSMLSGNSEPDSTSFRRIHVLIHRNVHLFHRHDYIHVIIHSHVRSFRGQVHVYVLIHRLDKTWWFHCIHKHNHDHVLIHRPFFVYVCNSQTWFCSCISWFIKYNHGLFKCSETKDKMWTLEHSDHDFYNSAKSYTSLK